VVTAQIALLTANLLTAQSVQRYAKVSLKEIHFTGQLGLSVSELREYTDYLRGHPAERAKIQEAASSAVASGLRHRGYLKAQVTSELHSLNGSMNSKDAEAALEVTIQAGTQYRLKDITFAGVSNKLPQADLAQAFNLRHGDVADAEAISVGADNLMTQFRRKGKDVFIVPNLIFDDAASTVSLIIDTQK
jgi:outer membrane protein assembly factor BamA